MEKWSQRLVRLSNQRLRQRRDRVTSPGALCTQHRGRERRATVSNACRHTTNRSLVVLVGASYIIFEENLQAARTQLQVSMSATSFLKIIFYVMNIHIFSILWIYIHIFQM